ncbi:MAG: ATP-grasp domain-containing protein [Rikenellaceae bacterium]
MKNILITSSGKRVGLVRAFQDTLRKHDSSAKVFTVDMNPDMAPACIVSDGAFRVNRVTDRLYIPQLLTICQQNDIAVIIPTIDTELLILSENKEYFAKHGISVLVSDFDFISSCRDKRKTNVLFENLGVRIPSVIDINKPTFPIFAKPYDGSLSQGIVLINSADELTIDIINNPKLMFMEYIDKSIYKEFTVDMYYGKDNILKCIVPRERIEIRAGEINKGCTRKNKVQNELRKIFNHIDGVVGAICVQVFFCEASGDIVAIEINPRFGGGYTMSYAAKANFPDMIVREYLLLEDIEFEDDWVDNQMILRYDCDLIC